MFKKASPVVIVAPRLRYVLGKALDEAPVEVEETRVELGWEAAAEARRRRACI